MSPSLKKSLASFKRFLKSLYGSDSHPELDIGKFDVAIRTLIENREDLIQEFLKEYHLTLYPSKDYIRKNGSPKGLDDLNHHKLLAYGGKDLHPFGDVDWHLSLGMPLKEKRKYIFSSNSSSNLFIAAEEGLGIITLPRGYPPLKKSKLVPILPDIGPKTKSYCIYPKHLRNFERIKVFIAFLKDCHARFE